MHKSRIVFMGTPDFSVPALRSLAAHDAMEICLVVTQPDRPKGRGKKLAFSPVKQAAIELGIEIFQPESLKTDDAVRKLAAQSPDFYVVAAYGQILTQAVLDIPEHYPINIHASLLPQYRGASPIQAAISNMDAETGITTMVMAKAMDAGDILMTGKTPIYEDDTAQTLGDRLADIGAKLIIDTILALRAGSLDPTPQDHSKATYVKLLKKQDGRINWQLENRQIHAHIKAMNPWPGAFTRLNGQSLKIFKAEAVDTHTPHDPGTVFQTDKTGIYVAAGTGSLVIKELMGTSGKHLTAQQYLCGHDLAPLTRFDQ